MAELWGLEVGDLDEGCVPLEVLISVKALDEDGEVHLFERTSPGLSPWEALGMAITHADGIRASLTSADVEED